MQYKELRSGCFSFIFLISALFVWIGLIILYSGLVGRFTLAKKVEPQSMKVLLYDIYNSGSSPKSPQYRDKIHRIEGYLLSDSLNQTHLTVNDFDKLEGVEININENENRRGYHHKFTKLFQDYLIEHDSLIPIWKVRNKSHIMFRYESEGELFDINRRYNTSIWLGIAIIAPFLICLFIHFISKKKS